MFLSYLRRHLKLILMLALFCVIFVAVFSLYDLPAEAVGYAAALCAAAGAVFFSLGFWHYWRKHRALEDCSAWIKHSLEGLPPAAGAVERDYQELLRLLLAEKSALERLLTTERRDAADYYTLWAHQIKTPIAAMRLILQQDDAPQNAALLAELFRVEQYVEMVLSYIRLDSEASDLVLRECDLDEIVRGCIRKYAKLFILRKIPLEFRETHLKVLTDEKWLAFVIEQLLSNAIKYTNEGLISVYAEGNALCISDTGIGISPEDLPRVFDKGYTGYNGREYKKSTGIGLYLCRRVCLKLGHGLSLASNVGEGTTAKIGLGRKETIME